MGRRGGGFASTLTRSQRLKALSIAMLGYPLVAGLGRTLSWTVEGMEHYDDLVRTEQPPILALWHGRIVAATLFWRDRGIVALTSANFDGEWTAQLMSRFGYRAARGSTSRNGARALAQLRRELATGHPVAFTVDGPRGPAGVVQPGAVWLAGATGQPIVPFHIEASRCWTAASWDRSMVPKPFSRLAVAVGRPLTIRSTSVDILSEGCSMLRETLVALEKRCAGLLGRV